jgi:hypothetical protein
VVGIDVEPSFGAYGRIPLKGNRVARNVLKALAGEEGKRDTPNENLVTGYPAGVG